MTVTKLIEGILAVNRPSRNSDTELIINIMQRYGVNLSEQQIARLRKMPSFETIRRVRQQLQHDGKYPADQKIKKERDWKAMRVQLISPNAKPEYIEKVIEPRQQALSWLDKDDL